MKTYFCTYLCSALLAVAVTPVVIWIAHKLKLLDSVSARKVHSKPIPRIGGVAIFVSATALVITVLFLDNGIGGAFRSMQAQVITLLAVGTFIFCVGLFDDLHGIRARYKLLAQIIAAVVMCLAGVQILSFRNRL